MDGIGPSLELVVSGDGEGAIVVSQLVENAHAAGLVVHAYTARADALPSWATSYPHLLETLLHNAELDGVFTDFPGAERSSREPLPFPTAAADRERIPVD